ncbi:MAG: hypothetical protein Q8K28_07110 [Hoeflea sp.]|uniref:hypothetical protein n=1 Tax=Hoeflea sp. TaxID=1940281 RepID=UPI002731CAB4|nr:hypothetical protein [Hoeflea sp.]MDP2119652.1 hypothetical protein [Hoeflea sp.]
MATGIEIKNTRHAVFENVKISGFDVGISVENSSFSTKNMSFENVRQPFSISGSKANVVGTRIRNDPKVNNGANKSHVGWQPTGPSLPAKCDNCGSIFPSRNYGIRSSSFYGFDNEETCPVCHNEHAKVDDGLFEITEDAIRIITSLKDQPETLSRLASISTGILSGAVSPADGVIQFGDVSPKLKVLADKAASRGLNAGFWLSLAASLAMLAYSQMSSISEDDLRTIVANEMSKVVISTPSKPEDKPAVSNGGIPTDDQTIPKPTFKDSGPKRSPKGGRLKK